MNRKITRLLLRLESRRRLATVLVLSVIVSMLDVVSLALLFPIFFIVSRSTSAVDIGELPNFLRWILGDSPGPERLYILGIVFVLVILMKNLAAVCVYRLQINVSKEGVLKLSNRLARGYLAAPLAFHLGRKNAQYVRGLRDLPTALYYRGALGYCNLIAEAGGVLVLTLALLMFEPIGMLCALVFLAIMVCLNYRVMGRFFQTWGKREAELVRSLYSLTGQIFPNIKVVKASAAEEHLFEKFVGVQSEAAQVYRNQRFAQSAIRPVSEIIMLLAGIMILSAILWRSEAVTEALPFVAVFAYGALRLLPSINRISAFANDLRSIDAVLDELETELDGIEPYLSHQGQWSHGLNICFRDSLELRDVAFRYPGKSSMALSGVNFMVRSGQVIGLTGSSGAGKSTLVDVLLGLLEPTEGQILVDGRPPERGTGESGLAGYVPQTSPLINGTIQENIAFGAKPEEIDEVLLDEAVAGARLADTIKNLPQGLETVVGEFGSNLSGGQKQRIAIARALYARPSLLILDEATSDLDTVTEFEITSAINNLRGDVTIVLVAHRMHLLKLCDEIIFMKAGRMNAAGTYNRLLETSPDFMELATMSENYPAQDRALAQNDG